MGHLAHIWGQPQPIALPVTPLMLRPPALKAGSDPCSPLWAGGEEVTLVLQVLAW